MKRSLALLTCSLALTVAGAPAAEAATYRSCGTVDNPYAGTRYDGVDLNRIRALHVAHCSSARRVARGAHHKALGITPPPSGVRSFSWNGWKVRGDLRGDMDSYVAVRGGRRVRWVF